MELGRRQHVTTVSCSTYYFCLRWFYGKNRSFASENLRNVFIKLHKNAHGHSHAALVITFRVSRRRREIYSGHARLCLSVCLTVPRRSNTTARTRM